MRIRVMRWLRSSLKNCLATLIIGLAWISCPAQSTPLQIDAKVHGHYRFVVYGDTRFTDPANKGAANAEVRQQLVKAIATAGPRFVVFGGDIAYKGERAADWQVYDNETAI